MPDISNRILAALGTKGAWVSSARMVEELGISRMAICKQVRRLRRLGYGIAASPRHGYRLTARTDLAVPEEVTPLLRTRVIGRPYRHFAEIDSTNEFLRTHAAEFPEGTTVAADSQTEGRGRFQRDWFSPSGVNVYLSILLKPAVSPLLAPQLSLVAAAAVMRALHAHGCEEARVKWPNDILWRGKKLAGILCEMDAEADVIHAVIIGIGVNVNLTAFPQDLQQTATSVREALGRPVSVPALAAEILNRLDEEYADWARVGLSAIADFLNRHSMLSGREVAIALSGEAVSGQVERITDTGVLRLIQAGGAVHDIASGEVRLCRPAAASRRGREDE
jgi:BirA family biotin operon repressor/biotin-[acetyl-CoA-carboxylase] ligase